LFRRPTLGLASLALLVLVAGLSGCGRVRLSEEDCMARAMYFESNRSSHDGMLAVGTVVMNRKASGKYPKSVCGVVGQKKQFAPGVLSKRMDKGEALARSTAREVLRGARHAEVGGKAMFFHTAGYSFPYNNMHYVAIAGGNAFYEKRKNPTQSQADVASRGDRLRFEPPARTVAARERRIASRIEGVDAPPPGPAATLGASSDVALPAMTIEEAIAGGGLY
jgi:hypothetical protein